MWTSRIIIPSNAQTISPVLEYEVQKGDLLITRGNTPQLVADVCIATEAPKRLMLSDLIYRIKTDPEQVEPGYLAAFLLSRSARDQIELDARGSSLTMVKVSQGHIRSWLWPKPPKEEQARLLNMILKTRNDTAGVISEKRSLIESLKEYRTSLIYEAVTGKIDLRAA